ncbi:MAG: hypothetical protein U1B78_03110 [Dehalococcoidia bacterium]|nr:hypothetical protein [Dehalococcoidia bacterium]
MGLDAAIEEYVDAGYRLVLRHENVAQLVRPKTFSFLSGVLFPLVALMLFLATQDDQVYLSETGGEVSVIEHSGTPDKWIQWAAGVAALLQVWGAIILIAALTRS